MRWMLLLVLVGACRSEREAPAPTRVHVPPSSKYIAPTVAPVLPSIPVGVRFEDDEPSIGAIVGVVLDMGEEPIAGATLVATSKSLEGTMVAISEDDGSYIIDDLPPDDYLVTLYYVDEVQEYQATVGDEAVELNPTLVILPPTTVTIFGCGSSLENTYVVDGIDTTGLTFGE
jgi:hypothetical protein